ncbi:MAG: hypothetical protein ACKVQQ_09375, partial [Burkholderiales bacterium]
VLCGEGAVLKRPVGDRAGIVPDTSAAEAAAAAAARKPPALPFRFVGRVEEGNRAAAILLFGQATLVVRVGDTLERNYRVEEVGARALVLTYLPLNERQTLELGGRS